MGLDEMRGMLGLSRPGLPIWILPNLASGNLATFRRSRAQELRFTPFGVKRSSRWKRPRRSRASRENAMRLRSEIELAFLTIPLLIRIS